MRVWRICKPEYAAFDGEGGKLVSGRWHHRGLPIVYTAGSLALAALEFYVHLSPDIHPRNFIAIPAEIPERVKLEILSPSNLPSHWREPRDADKLREIGMEWLHSGRTAVLAVPSAVVPVEQNYLLNPRHKAFSQIRVNTPQPFEFDYRMWKPK